MERRFRNRRRLLAALGAGAAWPLARTAGAQDRTVPGDAEAALLAIDPERVTGRDVRDVLARVPAPRIVLLQGSVPLVTMAPFGAFLAAMGYPDAQLRDLRSGDYSQSSYASSRELAGELAWHYERDGVRPMVIGHSQGGMLAVRVLHELAGAFSDAIEVVDGTSGQPTGRRTFRDPVTGDLRPVVGGFALPYATALATGKLFRVLLGQWSMISRLSKIPDTVEEFTGFSLPNDPISAGAEPYEATGTAKVRNVALPADYSHIGLPRVAHLAADPPARAWIDAYVPDSTAPPGGPGFDTTNLLHAADIWHSVKRHWCREAQRLAAASRTRG
jgi:hypothetical protein